MRPLLLLSALLLAVAGLTTGSCARARASAALAPPPLNVPLPPPRIVETVVVEVPPPAPPAQELPVPLPVPAPAAAAPRPARAEPPRAAEPPKTDAAPVLPAGPRLEEPKSPALQSIPAQQEGRFEAEVRVVLGRASTDLNRIDYRALGSDARIQYDQAKAFMRQAEDSLRVKNLVFARSLADKAATLASQLLGR
jgi:hypothetical protein